MMEKKDREQAVEAKTTFLEVYNGRFARHKVCNYDNEVSIKKAMVLCRRCFGFDCVVGEKKENTYDVHFQGS